MTIYRLTRRIHAALSGEGARVYGGRWNSPGFAVVYTAAEPALAVLETLVHLELDFDEMPTVYVMMGIELPDPWPESVLSSEL